MAPEELKVHHIGGKEEVGNCLITFFYSHTGNRKRDEAGSTVRSLTLPKVTPIDVLPPAHLHLWMSYNLSTQHDQLKINYTDTSACGTCF